MQRRGISLQRAKLYASAGGGYSARGIKSVILALHYFSAAAGDALNESLLYIFSRSLEGDTTVPDLPIHPFLILED
jgi:hypothetical protein